MTSLPPEWNAINRASTKATGGLLKVITVMEEAVSKRNVSAFLKQLGLYSSGFLFHDYFLNKTTFFNVEDKRKFQGTYKTPYQWENDDLSKFDEFLHWVFVKTRQLQGDRTGNRNHLFKTIDFFENLVDDSKLDNRMLGLEKWYREEFSIHYCSLGETLSTLFYWRMLSFLQACGYGEMRLVDVDISDVYETVVGIPFVFLGFDYVETGREIDPEISLSLEKRELEEIFQSGDLIAELDRTKLRCEDKEKQSSNRKATIRFLSEVGCCCDVSELKKVEDSDLTFLVFLFQNLISFLSWLNKKKKWGGSVKDALSILENRARFPVSPFFLWNSLNDEPVCYFVSPVWSSQNDHLEIGNWKCNHCGLALAGVKPLKRIDWTIEGLSSVSSTETDLMQLLTLLRMMARPLVETNLYWPAILELLLDRESAYDSVLEDFYGNESDFG